LVSGHEVQTQRTSSWFHPFALKAFRRKIIAGILMKKNCWEVTGCGRERGGKKENELGLCPAAADERLHGVHGGMNAGRACWVVAGTFCEGEVQGTFAQKLGDCMKCDFFNEKLCSMPRGLPRG
jgi:hypothetical protein